MTKYDATDNYKHKTEHGSSSELAPASWVDALAERWERRAHSLSDTFKTNAALRESSTWLAAAAEMRRAQSESASTDRI